ncbi:HNH endonuclease family protein [Gleimia sp. 6138-11-ORH1]|uniref:HNH endonuclease family protein n=1 Tax=Gleimia sp. 6138-11-ORH1 TaxID=2973937 RepID=UPI002167FF11|nr:HNH endonuclease family protein [Gleimia sp. 6138-11-ORH1]MCS4485091.1 HNH endonuclease family protein [Gleimia sp. 6138-11-ORH1]
MVSTGNNPPKKSAKFGVSKADLFIYAVVALLALVLFFLLNPTIGRNLFWGKRVEDLPASQAKTALLSLKVRDKEQAPEYRREVFGPSWEDTDNNGCDTRNDVLRRDLTQVEFKKGRPRNCVVNRGVLEDPYTGKRIDFVRGPETSPVVQIDHVVALGDAWRAGAYQWGFAKRVEFANDPENLLAVVGYANEDKGRQRADEWLPPNSQYHCAYVARQIRVKAKWELSVTSAEKETMIAVLAKCPAVE